MNEKESLFDQYIVDFYQYMITDGNLQRKTSHDYISRLRFLSKTYNLDSAITMSYIDEILENESRLLTERDFYNSKHAIGDFQAGLKKFLSFIQSNYQERKEENLLSEIRKIESSGDLTITEKRQLLKARVGQGDFRKHLIEYWQCCSVTGCSRLDCLMASHIKPWRKSNNQERLDVFNGLLLTPNLDKLFDKGYITFEEHGRIVFSSFVSKEDQEKLYVEKTMALLKLSDHHKPYLKYHNNNCFLG